MPPATVTRRRVLQTSLAAVALGGWRLAHSQPAESSNWLLFGGSQGKGIYRARWNAATGEIGPAELAAATAQPTYLTQHPTLPILYACNETDAATTAAVSAFRIQRASAQLQPLGTQLTGGAAPCYASVDATGSLLFAANYGGGSLAVFPLGHDGKPGAAATVFACAGNRTCGTGGPVKERQSSPTCTAPRSPRTTGSSSPVTSATTPSSPFRSTRTPLIPWSNPPASPQPPAPVPRHLAFHPNGQWLYCMNEINCTVSLYRWSSHSEGPSAEPVSEATVSVRPPNTREDPPSTGAELHVSRDGRFLYTSTRFCDVLTVFSVDPTHGHLTQIQQIPCGGETPRFFALDPTEHWLVCANQDSNNIAVFARDNNTGRLTPGGTYPAINPECLFWL